MPTQDPTTNYGWNLPAVGGSAGSWGSELNAIIGDDASGIDAVVKDVSDVADAAMPKAGGTFTGEIVVKVEKYEVVDKGSMTGAVSLDLSTADFFFGTVAGNITLSFANVPATGKAVFVILEFTNPGAFTITWPGSVKWPGGSAPAWTASGVDVVSLYTRDGGTTWRAALAQEDSR